jgi:hypothetical protein
VRSASSKLVRLPIFREGVDQWRNYEPWFDVQDRRLSVEAADSRDTIADDADIGSEGRPAGAIHDQAVA